MACFWYSRCCSAQVSHLIWPWMVRAQQSTHSPRALASFRLAWVWWRCSSLRSGVLFLFRSYSCRFSFLASTSAGVGSGRRFGVAFLQGLLMVGFRFSFRDFFSLAWGLPPALLGSGNGMVSVKVRPTAPSCGVCEWDRGILNQSWGSPPCPRGLAAPPSRAGTKQREIPVSTGSGPPCKGLLDHNEGDPRVHGVWGFVLGFSICFSGRSPCPRGLGAEASDRSSRDREIPVSTGSGVLAGGVHIGGPGDPRVHGVWVLLEIGELSGMGRSPCPRGLGRSWRSPGHS